MLTHIITAPLHPAVTPTPVWPYLGLDEAGRGCLAGPVAAAAVLLPSGCDVATLLPGLGDSKHVSARQRALLETQIKSVALCWSLGLAWPEEIDRVNILQATLRAMARAASRLKSPLPPESCHLAVDGNHCISLSTWQAVSTAPLPRQTACIGGDARIAAISAASILAKEFRDRLMRSLDKRYPGYGFARHKGYGTQDHLRAVTSLGPSAMHRRTFKGVRPEEQQHSLFQK